jgi:hypothetical protein
VVLTNDEATSARATPLTFSPYITYPPHIHPHTSMLTHPLQTKGIKKGEVIFEESPIAKAPPGNSELLSPILERVLIEQPDLAALVWELQVRVLCVSSCSLYTHVDVTQPRPSTRPQTGLPAAPLRWVRRRLCGGPCREGP